MADPSYEPVASAYPGAGSLILQFGLWDALSTWFVESFQVRQPIEELAGRFRIQLETSFDQLDEVKAACFQMHRRTYAIVSHKGSPVPGTLVWLLVEEQHEDSASVFLETFGLTEEDVLWRAPTDDDAARP